MIHEVTFLLRTVCCALHLPVVFYRHGASSELFVRIEKLRTILLHVRSSIASALSLEALTTNCTPQSYSYINPNRHYHISHNYYHR
jgi:hypothetical protein